MPPMLKLGEWVGQKKSKNVLTFRNRNGPRATFTSVHLISAPDQTRPDQTRPARKEINVQLYIVPLRKRSQELTVLI